MRMVSVGFMEILECACPFLRPALDNDFGLREELDGMSTLAVQVAEETFPGAAERKERHRRGDADVDADVANLRFVAKLAGAGAVAGKEAGHVAVGARIRKGDGLVDGL